LSTAPAEIDTLDQPGGGPGAAPAIVGSPPDQQISVPTKDSLRWPLIVALRDLGGSADIIDIEKRVSDLLELTTEQTTIEVPSGGITKLQNRLGWAGFELKQQQILTYPSRGQRELTSLGITITEAQLDDLFRGKGATDPGTAAGRRLELVVQRFREETGYPTEAHEEQKRLRQEWAEKLHPENIESLSRRDLIAVVWNGTFGSERYVCPPDELPHVRVMWVEHLDDEAFARLIGHIRYLCSGEDEPSIRYDRLTDHSSPRKTKNFGDAATSKVLAICYPEQFLPVGVSYGQGRDAMLQRLNLPEPRGASNGQRVVDANDRLRAHLSPQFDDDLFGMATFLYWLMEQEDPPELQDEDTETSRSDLVGLSKKLLIDVGFLEDIVELLEDKGQVILYGPPGTGKTYLAQALAEELAPDESCRALVQFHPSTSYEDFFEGYRPVGTTADGGIRYELTPGPLARMAERASETPGEQHVMVIDEINRGNLPRVLGELLFLLEYRDESILPLYRPDKPFKLPANLWFIGTMNTADRSIALVDAALRRRFHFVPFFPDSGPIAGLLGRWLAREHQPAWVGDLVDAVNNELARDFDGSHLLLGPSHFMKDYGSTPGEHRERLRRIWEYNIEPFIEDQFFGDPDRIDHYRYPAIIARHGPAAGSEGAADAGEDATPDAPADSSSDGATEDTASEVGAP